MVVRPEGKDFNPSLYSTNSPELADMYAGYHDKWPGPTPSEGTFPEGAVGMPLYLNTKDYFITDAGGEKWTEVYEDAINNARKEGKKGVVIHNVWDEPNATKSLGSPKTVYITFPEGMSTAKSKFASEFNPLSPDMTKALLAAAGTGAVIHVLNPSESKAAQPDHSWLNAYPEKK